VQTNLPVLKGRLDLVIGIAIATQPLSGSSLRILCIEHITCIVQLNNIRKDCIGCFKRTWLVGQQGAVVKFFEKRVPYCSVGNPKRKRSKCSRERMA